MLRRLKEWIMNAIVQDDPNPEYSYLDRRDGLR